jgi:hypothetical protein
MPSLGLIHFPTIVRAGIEFTKPIERLIPMKITIFGRNTLQKSKGQFSKKIAYYPFAALITILWGAGITPSIANDNNAASSPVKSATQATSNALSSIILGNAMGGSGGFKLKLGSAPQFKHFSALDKDDDKQISDTQSSREESGRGGIAASPDFSNWSVWATPVVSSFKNNIEPYTSTGTVSIALMGLVQP